MAPQRPTTKVAKLVDRLAYLDQLFHTFTPLPGLVEPLCAWLAQTGGEEGAEAARAYEEELLALLLCMLWVLEQQAAQGGSEEVRSAMRAAVKRAYDVLYSSQVTPWLALQGCISLCAVRKPPAPATTSPVMPTPGPQDADEWPGSSGCSSASGHGPIALWHAARCILLAEWYPSTLVVSAGSALLPGACFEEVRQ